MAFYVDFQFYLKHSLFSSNHGKDATALALEHDDLKKRLAMTKVPSTHILKAPAQFFVE
jgi:hypothetical protein